ncbi:MAG: glycogen/starch synthase [Bacteroidia bacterium]|nr:glycogen/starch synthase [Bacteroidia bacterium]
MAITGKKVLFVSSEMSPFLEESQVSSIAKHLPQAIQEHNNEIRVLVPRFGLINERRNRLHEVVRLSGINISIGDNDNPLVIKVASIPGTRIQVYFLDNEDFFHRKHLYHDENKEFFDDNDERTIFFCKGVLETVKKLGWAPDIIHCQGWMTSLIPLYVKTIYKDEPVFRNSKVIYSVFAEKDNACLGEEFAQKASLNELDDKHLECFGKADFMGMHIGGVSYSDAVINCSDCLSPELKEYIKGKPNLKHPAGDIEYFAEKYVEFYGSVLDKS